MRHDHAERLIASLALGGLEGEERQAVEIHVAECETCRQALADLRATYALLAEAVAALPREELGAERRQAVLTAVQTAGEPATAPAAASTLPPAETLLPAGRAAPVPRARPLPRRPRRLLWLGVGMAAVLVLCGLLLPVLARARYHQRDSFGWSGPRPVLAVRSAVASHDSRVVAASAPAAPPFADSAAAAPSAAGGMMGGEGGSGTSAPALANVEQLQRGMVPPQARDNRLGFEDGDNAGLMLKREERLERGRLLTKRPSRPESGPRSEVRGDEATSRLADANATVAAGTGGRPGAAGDRSEVLFARQKNLTDSLAATTAPAARGPAAPVVDYELDLAKEAKAAAGQSAPQEPALLAANEVTEFYSKLAPGQASHAGAVDQIQFSTAADKDADRVADLSESLTAPLLGDVPMLGRLAGKEGAKPEAESADPATVRYDAATAVDPFAAGTARAELRARKPAAKDAAAKPDSSSAPAPSRPAEESKRKGQPEPPGLTPETAARQLVEENETLAPAQKWELLQVLRQRQVATLTHQERPLSEEELAAPPAAPPAPVNPFVMTDKDRLSTFALEAESASYALARRYIANRRLPPPGLIRMEEFVNAFDYAYPAQSTRTFAIHAEAGPAPYGKALTLLRIGVKAKVLGRDGRKPAHLVFVIDASGSMGREDRLPLVQLALGLMVTQLDPRDRLSLVTYDTQARLLLEAVPAARAAEIQAAVGALATGATTNLQAGVELGYQIAARHFRSGETNRVILCSDGVANVGPADAAAILAKVEQYRRQGITLTSVGVGSGSYDDRMLEQLANRGDGNYVFVDSPEQARRVFVDDFAGTLQMVARNAKIQVEFNPLRVRRYRLIGYENRDVADQDFRNDAVDAGEIGSGQAATALYELELLPVAGDAAVPPDLGTVYVRYENVDSGRVEEISSRLSTLILQDRAPERDPRFFLAACAAEFAEILRQSEHARDGSLQALESNTTRVANALPLDQRAQELLTLVRRAEGLPR